MFSHCVQSAEQTSTAGGGQSRSTLPPALLTVPHAGAQQGDGPPRLVWVAVSVGVMAGAVPMVAHGSHDGLRSGG